MTVVQAIVTGIVQGVTEWLPISSKSHLVVIPAVFGWPHPDLAFITFLHLGTLVGLVAYLAKDLLRILLGLRRRGSEERRLAGLLALATVPAAALGLLFEASFARWLDDPPLVAFSLIATAALLTLAEWFAARSPARIPTRPLREVPLLRDAVGMGLAQALALLPGVSRSGSTMAAGLAGGLTRASAARFSFLMAIPVTAGAQVLELPQVARAGIGAPEVAGFLASLVAGYLSVAWLLRFLRTRSFLPFAAYCLVFAVSAGTFLALKAPTG